MEWSIENVIQTCDAELLQIAGPGHRARGSILFSMPVRDDLVLRLLLKRPRPIRLELDCFIDFQPTEQCALMYRLLERRVPRHGEVFFYATNPNEFGFGGRLSSEKKRAYAISGLGWDMSSHDACRESLAKIGLFITNELKPFAERWNSLHWVDVKNRTEYPTSTPFSFGPQHWALLNFSAFMVAGRKDEAVRELRRGEASNLWFTGSSSHGFLGPKDWPIFCKNAGRLLEAT